MDHVINNLPIEFHLPTLFGSSERVGGSFDSTGFYSYCGPGTKYDQRISEGYAGVNHLDKLCRLHDAAYAAASDRSGRIMADRELMNKAFSLALDPSHDYMERFYALIVAGVFGGMSSKFAIGNRPLNSFLPRSYSFSHSSSASKLMSSLLRLPRLSKTIGSESVKARQVINNLVRSSSLLSSISSFPNFLYSNIPFRRRHYKRKRLYK